jgi:hypothetical protein
MNDHQPTINLGPIIFIGLLLFGLWYDMNSILKQDVKHSVPMWTLH